MRRKSGNEQRPECSVRGAFGQKTINDEQMILNMTRQGWLPTCASRQIERNSALCSIQSYVYEKCIWRASLACYHAFISTRELIIIFVPAFPPGKHHTFSDGVVCCQDDNVEERCANCIILFIMIYEYYCQKRISVLTLDRAQTTSHYIYYSNIGMLARIAYAAIWAAFIFSFSWHNDMGVFTASFDKMSTTLKQAFQAPNPLPLPNMYVVYMSLMREYTKCLLLIKWRKFWHRNSDEQAATTFCHVLTTEY